jgi:hypothetical protein
MASEMPAMAKATASRFLENLRVFKDGVSALLACLLGSVGGGVGNGRGVGSPEHRWLRHLSLEFIINAN